MAENAGGPEPVAPCGDFSSVAARYDVARPGYPEALVVDVVEMAEQPVSRVVEVGAGTGKATMLFGAEDLEILAIEPDPAMAQVATDRCGELPKVRVVIASFETWSPPLESFDLLISAQAWHWIDPQVRYHKAARVLRPGGGLALFWSRPMWDRFSLIGQIIAAYRAHAPELIGLGPWFPGFVGHDDEVKSGFRPDDWVIGAQAREITDSGLFEDPVQKCYRWSETHIPSGVVGLLRSLPEHDSLGEDRTNRFFRDLETILAESAATTILEFETVLFFSRRHR